MTEWEDVKVHYYVISASEANVHCQWEMTRTMMTLCKLIKTSRPWNWGKGQRKEAGWLIYSRIIILIIYWPFDVLTDLLIDWLVLNAHISSISAICSTLWCIFTDLIIIIWHCQTCSTRKQNLCPLMRQNILWKFHYKNNYW